MMDLRKSAMGLATLTVFALATAVPASAEIEGARDLVKRALDALPKVSFTAKLKVTTAQGGRELELNHKLVDGARSNYLEVAAPPELQGIRFLFMEKLGGAPEQYMKVAAAKTTVRIADEVRKQPFLGSTFYVADLVEPALDDFTYKYAGEFEVLGRKCMLVESVPKNPAKEVYSKTLFAIDPKDALILRRQFFDQKGAVLKVWTVEKVDQIDGIWTIMEQRMTNVLENSQSRLDVTEVKYNVELPNVMFTPKYLLR
jgi:negative regulator of sigma E activity